MLPDSWRRRSPLHADTQSRRQNPIAFFDSVTDDDAKKQYPQAWKAPKPYICIVPQPKV
jgi:hypothetical protein